MDRREFIATGAISTAGLVFFPGNLLAKESKELLSKKFPQPLPFKQDGEWKEFELYVDLTIWYLVQKLELIMEIK